MSLKLPPKSKRKKTTQHGYSSKTRGSIGNIAALHGPTAAVKHFSGDCAHNSPESTRCGSLRCKP